MKAFVQRMIEEHAQLVKRIEKLHNYIYSKQSDNDDKVEFANKCIQLAAMKKYEEALNARLYNAGVHFENGQYKEVVATIKENKYFDADGKVDEVEEDE
jgi:hypothetical protein